MDSQRAQDIFNAPCYIEVQHRGKSVQILEVKGDQARVRYEDENTSMMIPVAEMTEM